MEGCVEGGGYVVRSSIAGSEGFLSIVPPCLILCGFPRMLLTRNAILASSMDFSGLGAPRGLRSNHSDGVGSTLLNSGMDPA